MPHREHIMKNVLSFLGGLLSGAIVGAAVVVLLAPQSGVDTRQSIVKKYHEIIDAGRQTILERRQALRGEYQAAIRIPVPITEVESE
jgi:gas vesicle protein